MTQKAIQYRVLGLMSGTSLDGLDLALCDFEYDGNWSFKIIAGETFHYSEKWTKKLKKAHKKSDEKLSDLNQQYGEFLADACLDFLNKYPNQVDLIASHGHTVFHQPDKQMTLQIGDGEIIAQRTGITTVYDFRSADLALGGQGAPLVPVGDHLLFHEYDCCLNLGGFANISFQSKGKRIAFDICPVNFVLNRLVKPMGKTFDEGGKIAASGKVNKSFLAQLNDIPFYQKAFPKSLGREWVKSELKPYIKAAKKLDTPDLLSTFCEHIAIQIAKVIPSNKKSLLITGGGALNTYLLSRIQHHVSEGVEIVVPDQEVVDFKEALLFAFLGVLRFRDEVNVYASVTGAPHDHSSGKVAIP